MGRETQWGFSDRQYLRLDGKNAMAGPLRLPGMPTEVDHATQKAYVDALVAAINFLTPAQIATLINDAVAAGVAPYLPLAGGTLTGDLTLNGAPTLALHAATMAYADLMLPLAGGVMGGVLTLAADPLLAMQAATKQYVDALPVPGLDTYDATVDAAGGGDYVSIVTACNTELASARIYVKAGTYNEVADILMKDGQMLIGQNPDNTIINFGGNNAQVTYQGVPLNLYLANFTIQNSTADWYVHFIGDFARVDNCRFVGAGAASFGGVHLAGEKAVISRCSFTTFSRAGEYCIRIGEQGTVEANYITTCQRGIYAEDHVTVIGNTIEAMTNQQVLLKDNTTLVGNVLNGSQKVMISGRETQIVGNYFFSASNIEWEVNDDGAVITGNGFYISTITCALAGVQRVVISGNTIVGGGPVTVDGQYFSITGNVFDDTSFLDLTGNAEYNIIAGNNFGRSTAGVRIADAGNVNHAYNNFGIPSLSEKRFSRLENTSGGALVAGDVIVFKAVAAGDEFTTTVNQGDDLVYGMLDENIANAAYGYIQRRGFTAKLKVNGTVDIAIGDLLGTYTAAGIAMKAATGDMAFAIALEAYATDDSAGVIDALLIEPVRVASSNYAGIGVTGNAVVTVIEMVSAYEMITVFAYDMPEKVANGAFGTNNITPVEDGDYNVHVNVTGSSAALNETYVAVLFALSPVTFPVSNVTNANPAVVTANGHTYINGDKVKITGVVGTIEVNDRVFTVAAAGANVFSLTNDAGANVNSGAWGVYAGPGTVQLATEIPVSHCHRKLTGIGDIGNFVNAGIAALVAAEPLELFVMNTTGANNFTAVDANVSIHRV